MEKPILSKKLRNSFVPQYFNCYLKNIVINGQKRGSSGFIENPINGRVVYLTTEIISGPMHGKLMYRNAKSLNDYVGGVNRWASSYEELVREVTKLLEEKDDGE